MVEQKHKFKKVILIIADTLRAKNVGIYGRKPSPTPNLDNIGKRGIVFSNTYATTTFTDPSVTSIMTGKYPISVGLINHGPHVTKEEIQHTVKAVFLSEILSENGYKTIAIDWMSRWHKRGYGRYSGRINKQGIKNWVTNSPPLFFYLRFLDKICVLIFKREFFLRLYYALGRNPQIPYDPADIVIDKAIDELNKYQQKDLFLYIHLWDCHIPYTKSKGIRSYLMDNVIKTYEDEIKFMDHQIWRLYNYLEKNNLLKDTLIVITSDHGENFSGPGRPFNHEGLSEDVVRVPLIISNPLFKQRRVSCLAQHVDIFPTILDLIGFPMLKNIDGKSLVKIMFGRRKKIRDFAYFEDLVVRTLNIGGKILRRRGIKFGDYKFIETISGNKNDLMKYIPENIKIVKRELYYLNKDKEEKDNIYTKNIKKGIELDRKLHSIINTLYIAKLKGKKEFNLRNSGLFKKQIKESEETIINLKSLGY